MKKVFMALIFITVIGSAMSVDTSSRIRALQKLLDYSMDYSSIYFERDQKVREATDIPAKGEFEDTQMYTKRVNASKQRAEQIKNDYSARIADLEKIAQQRREQIRNEIQSLIAQSRENFSTSNFQFLTYNADKQELPVKIGDINQTINAKVPIARAEYVKTNATMFKLSATRQLKENLTWDYTNWFLVGEGERFVVGTHQNTQQMIAAQTNYMPPSLTATAIFTEPSGNGCLDAEETGTIKVIVTNSGKGTAYAVDLKITSATANSIVFDQSVYFGEIKSQQTISQNVNISGLQNIKDGVQTFTLSFTEFYQFPPDPINITFNTKAAKFPQLILADKGINSKDGKITAGELADIVLNIQNIGQGVAKGVSVQIKPGNNVNLINTKEAIILGDIASGEYKQVPISLVTGKDAVELPVSIKINEQREQFSTQLIPLDLKLNQRQKTAQEIIIAGKEQTPSNIVVASELSVDIEKDLKQSLKTYPNRFAVIFGVQNYQREEVPQVIFAQRDASWFNEYALKTLGIPQNNIYFRTNEFITKAEFQKIFDKGGWLDKRIVAGESEVLFFFAGHGIPSEEDKKAYLAPNECDPNYANSTCYPVESIYQALNRMNLKSSIVLLDACFSGMSRDNKPIFKTASPVFAKTELPSSFPKQTILSASSSSQMAVAYPEKKHGLFSYYLMKGMQGAADINNDRKITIKELGDYVKKEVSRQAGFLDKEQNPDFITDNGNLVLIEY